jgi:hypothetical protein
MNEKQLIKWLGLDLMAAGIATALFWLLALPFETFAGPEVPQHALFAPGQWLHMIGAVLAVFGYTGLYLRLRDGSGWLGLVAYAIAVLGAMFFFADGAIALIVFPVLAEHAPALTEATGPMFTGSVLGFYITFAATNMIGIILLGWVALRSGHFPRLPALLFILGGILFNLPPNPALHLLLVAGGVIYGVGAVGLGRVLGERE